MKARIVITALILMACGRDATPTATPGASVPSGNDEFFAFVLEADESEIAYDQAELLTGDEAHDAAVAAGVIGETEDLPNDFFIDNPEVEAVTTTLSAAGNYVLIQSDAANEGLIEVILDRDEFVSALQSGEGYYGIVPGETPMMLTIRGDEVISAAQVYLP